MSRISKLVFVSDVCLKCLTLQSSHTAAVLHKPPSSLCFSVWFGSVHRCPEAGDNSLQWRGEVASRWSVPDDLITADKWSLLEMNLNRKKDEMISFCKWNLFEPFLIKFIYSLPKHLCVSCSAFFYVCIVPDGHNPNRCWAPPPPPPSGGDMHHLEAEPLEKLEFCCWWRYLNINTLPVEKEDDQVPLCIFYTWLTQILKTQTAN